MRLAYQRLASEAFHSTNHLFGQTASEDVWTPLVHMLSSLIRYWHTEEPDMKDSAHVLGRKSREDQIRSKKNSAF